jgi:DNA-binding transcriptional LysR family regulator
VPFQANSIESLRQMVSAGIGCTLLPALVAGGPFAAATPVVRKLSACRGTARPDARVGS